LAPSIACKALRCISFASASLCAESRSCRSCLRRSSMARASRSSRLVGVTGSTGDHVVSRPPVPGQELRPPVDGLMLGEVVRGDFSRPRGAPPCAPPTIRSAVHRLTNPWVPLPEASSSPPSPLIPTHALCLTTGSVAADISFVHVPRSATPRSGTKRSSSGVGPRHNRTCSSTRGKLSRVRSSDDCPHAVGLPCVRRTLGPVPAIPAGGGDAARLSPPSEARSGARLEARDVHRSESASMSASRARAMLLACSKVFPPAATMGERARRADMAAEAARPQRSLT
jgi:hypothetical protein